MSIKDGQLANDINLNNAFVSKSDDSTTKGKLNLSNEAAESGAPVLNVQAEINSLKTFKTATDNTLLEHSGNISELQSKSNIIKNVPPTVGDDSTKGYAPGKIWHDEVANTYYMCLSSDEGAALWREIKTGGAGSGRNYILNPDFEEDAEGYSVYLNAASAVPVSGTGGEPASTLTASSVLPLRGDKSGLFTKDVGNKQGEGFSTDFTIDPADRTKIVDISFDYETSENYKDGDIRIYIYDVSNLKLIELVNRDLMANANGTYRGFFQASPDSVNYRLIGHIATTNNLAYTVKLDEVKVSPQAPRVTGQIVLNQSSYLTSSSVFSNTIFKGALTDSTGSGIYSYDPITGIYTALKKAQVTITASAITASAVALGVGARFVVAGVNKDQFDHTNASTGQWASVTHSRLVNPGDTFYGHNASAVDTSGVRVSVTATHVSDNMVLSEDAGNRDVVAQYIRNTSQSVPASTATIINLDIKINDLTNAVTTGSGWRFTAPETAFYDLNGIVGYSPSGFNGTSDRVFIQYYLNGSSLTDLSNLTVDNPQSTASALRYVPFSKTIKLSKGDYVDFRIFSNIATSVSNANITIAKRSSPQTIAASETVAGHYSATSGSSISTVASVIKFVTKAIDTNNTYSSSTGTLEIPRAGILNISWQVGAVVNLTSSQRFFTILIKNGTTFRNGSREIGVGVSTALYSQGTVMSIPVNKGDKFEIHAVSDVTVNANTEDNVNYLTYSIE